MKTAFNFHKLTTKTFHTGSVNSRVAHKPLLCVCVCVCVCGGGGGGGVCVKVLTLRQ